MKQTQIPEPTQNKPIKVFSAGTVRATIWENARETDGVQYTVKDVKIEKGYKDNRGDWHNTNTYSVNDLARLLVVVTATHAWLLLNEGD